MPEISGELMPCPFCGWKEPKIIHNEYANMAWVACGNCGIEAPSETGVSPEDAAEYWNRRAEIKAARAGKGVGETVVVPLTPTAEMLRAGMDDLGWWVEPYTAPRESGVPVDNDMSTADAASINATQMAVIEGLYRAMLAAALPSPTGNSEHGGVSEEAVEAAARAMCLNGGFDPDERMPNDGPRWRYYASGARAALTAASGQQGKGVKALNTASDHKPLALRPIHLRLLERGESGTWIWLADDAGIHTAEVVALGELSRAGLVEHAKGPFPPGPPSPKPYVITDAGRLALAEEKR